MTRNTKALCFALLGFLSALMASVCVVRCVTSGIGKMEQRDTVRITVIRHDTVRLAPVSPRDSVIVRYVRVRVPADPIVLHDTVCLVSGDSAEVEIPIAQKRYDDSLYTAWVSGYMPRLDSISIYRTHEITTFTHTIRQKPCRWGIGVQVGYGLQLAPDPRLSPYVGIGVTYNLWNF